MTTPARAGAGSEPAAPALRPGFSVEALFSSKRGQSATDETLAADPPSRRYEVRVPDRDDGKFAKVGADGKVKMGKKKRATKWQFLQHGLEFVANDRYPREERRAMISFVRFAMKQAEKQTWSAIYDTYLEAVEDIAKGDLTSLHVQHTGPYFQAIVGSESSGDNSSDEPATPRKKKTGSNKPCFRFNEGRHCDKGSCHFRHVCSVCGSSKHGADRCPRSKDKMKKSKKRAREDSSDED